MVGRVFLGRYEPIKLLGEGGMGRVFLAKQADLGRQVVVKVMHDHIAADPKFRERFQRETLLMARFQHPCVVALYDASLDDPQGPCIVMEYIKGISLDVLLHRNGKMSPSRVHRLLFQLCEALQAAHQKGIVHRDLKPSNLMVVDPDTPYETIKVMDFGLAKLVEDEVGMNMYHKAQETGADFAVGTPGYISPEQVRGEDIGYRSDLYSVGVILYELLSGRLPFHREETMDVLLAHATESPPPFAEIGVSEGVSASVERVVMSCLEKDPNLRPASARDLAQAFEQAIFDDDSSPTTEQQNIDTQSEIIAAPPKAIDPNTIVYQMEAWMPDSLATFKLRGFVQDMDGEVILSQPGLIKVRLEDVTTSTWGLFKKRGLIDMELCMERNNPTQPNFMLVTVVMSSPDKKSYLSASWRERCNQIFVELRGYLAGNSITQIN
ncbi:MAG: serine/threonine-protein kinase [Planctomycetota bacterium]|jgi:serine/threonine protein kinase